MRLVAIIVGMVKKVVVNILRAFVDEEGKYGNPTGIIIDEKQELTTDERQKIATKSHYTDTVFINDLKTGNVSFFNPEQETKFAGDALISTAYFVKHGLGKKLDNLVCKGGVIKTWEEGELTWIEAGLAGTPGWNHEQWKSAKEIDEITAAEAAKIEHTMVWAWINEPKGLIRSRTFLLDWGTLEDQGNGSGSMQLASALGRKIEIHQGKGSVIFADSAGQNMAKVGGLVRVDEKKLINLPT